MTEWQRIPIYNDAHVHLGKSNSINQNFATLEQLERFRSKHDIDKMLVFPFELEPDKTNAKLSEYAKTHNWIKPLHWLSRSTPLREINGFVGCKFHGTFDNLPVSAPDYQSTMELLNDKGALLLVHCGRYLEGTIKSNTSYLHALLVAKKYPKIKVIFGHMGGSDTTVIKKAIIDGKSLPNVYFETSGITTPYAIEFALQHLEPQAILFGSDAPWCSFRAMVANIQDAQVSEREKEMILCDNFRRVVLGE